VGVQEAVEWDGVDPATGEDAYIDRDGNRLLYSEIISTFGSFEEFWDQHYKPVGNPWPLFAGGIDNRFRWKNWYMNILFTYSYGSDLLLGEAKRTLAGFGSIKVNPHSIVLDRWQQPGDDASISRLDASSVNWRNTTEVLYSNDYLRLKDLTIGYNFKFKEDAPVRGINCYLKFTNLLTFTNAPGILWDPEFAGVVQSRQGNNLAAGQNYKTTPQAKMYMLGISVDF